MPLFKPNIARLKQSRDLAGLVKQLQSKDPQTRRDALKIVGELQATSAIPALNEMLLRDDGEVKEKMVGFEE